MEKIYPQRSTVREVGDKRERREGRNLGVRNLGLTARLAFPVVSRVSRLDLELGII
jgi:hypothetical protein